MTPRMGDITRTTQCNLEWLKAPLYLPEISETITYPPFNVFPNISQFTLHLKVFILILSSYEFVLQLYLLFPNNISPFN